MKFICLFAFEFPIGIVDEDENSWSSVEPLILFNPRSYVDIHIVLHDEHVYPLILHEVVDQVFKQV